MSEYQNLVIELLNNSHNRPGFSCGVESLDNYIKKQAKQDVKRRISQVFVATQANKPADIIGYYTLSSLAIEFNQLPENLLNKLPRVSIPAALIGRLAVSQKAQKCGVGKMLLVDAIKRTLAVSNEIAIYAILVDAMSEEAEVFYKQFGFLKLNLNGRRMFLPLKTL